MIVCNRCGKENQNHYKFCLGCGNEIIPPEVAAAPAPPAPMPPQALAPPPKAPMAPRAPAAPQAAVSPTPPAGVPRIVEPTPLAPMGAPSPAGQDLGTAPTSPVGPGAPLDMERDRIPSDPAGAAPPANAPQKEPDKVFCTACGAANPRDFVFCGSCGNKLKKPIPPTEFYGGGEKQEPAPDPRWGRLCLIKPDGSMGGTFTLQGDEVMLGRNAGDLFAHDGYLSPVHTRLVRDGDEVIVEDAGSLNGVFVKITGEEPLADGDIFRLGQELLRFDVVREPEVLEDGTEIMGSPNPDYWGRLSLIAGPDIDGSAFPLMGDEVMLGRERGDILFPDDGYVSGIHAKISITEAGFMLTDLGSSNGTFLRLIEPRSIKAGAYILMGQQLFLMEMD